MFFLSNYTIFTRRKCIWTDQVKLDNLQNIMKVELDLVHYIEFTDFPPQLLGSAGSVVGQKIMRITDEMRRSNNE